MRLVESRLSFDLRGHSRWPRKTLDISENVSQSPWFCLQSSVQRDPLSFPPSTSRTLRFDSPQVSPRVSLAALASVVLHYPHYCWFTRPPLWPLWTATMRDRSSLPPSSRFFFIFFSRRVPFFASRKYERPRKSWADDKRRHTPSTRYNMRRSNLVEDRFDLVLVDPFPLFFSPFRPTLSARRSSGTCLIR